MTTCLVIRKTHYHAVFVWQQDGKRKQKSISTGIPVKGNNKRKAEAEMKRLQQEWAGKVAEKHTDILFSDYMLQWLESIRHTIADTTYHSYRNTIERRICPYFAKRKIKLCDIKAYHIQDFYTFMLNEGNVSTNTIHHYHANIHKALRNAYEMDRITENPASKVALPQKEKFRGDYYIPDELRALLNVVKGTKMEVPSVCVVERLSVADGTQSTLRPKPCICVAP